MVDGLNQAHALHAKLRSCTIEGLCDALSMVRNSQQSEDSGIEDNLIPTRRLSKKRADQRMSAFMPSFLETEMHESVHSSHEQFFQVLIPSIQIR